jgi:hypothetical protein
VKLLHPKALGTVYVFDISKRCLVLEKDENGFCIIYHDSAGWKVDWVSERGCGVLEELG